MKGFQLYLGILFVLILFAPDVTEASSGKIRILIISSYHKAYLWSQDTNQGVCAALKDFGYFDDDAQVARFTEKDFIESSTAVITRIWMDTKRRNSLKEMAQATGRVIEEAERFHPDIILLGDDNATNFIGNHYLDTDIPIVFWGVNGLPLKYGLLDSIEKPGHNITGIYQAGYLKEGIDFLAQLLPGIKTLAILSDQSPTGRSKAKSLQALARAGELPVEIVGTVVTNDLDEWKSGALELAETADAFFVLNHNTIKDSSKHPVDQLKLGAWYLTHILKPDIGHEKQFVEEGLLCAVDDSGFKQGYEAVSLAHKILQGASPAELPSYAPERGAFLINLERAKMLGIESIVQRNPLVEETIERAKALEAR